MLRDLTNYNMDPLYLSIPKYAYAMTATPSQAAALCIAQCYVYTGASSTSSAPCELLTACRCVALGSSMEQSPGQRSPLHTQHSHIKPAAFRRQSHPFID